MVSSDDGEYDNDDMTLGLSRASAVGFDYDVGIAFKAYLPSTHSTDKIAFALVNIHDNTLFQWIR